MSSLGGITRIENEETSICHLAWYAMVSPKCSYFKILPQLKLFSCKYNMSKVKAKKVPEEGSTEGYVCSSLKNVTNVQAN